MLLLAWGRNLMWFTELAFDLLPGYNKFRTVSMALVVVNGRAAAGALALMAVAGDPAPEAAAGTGMGRGRHGRALLLAVAGSAFFDFGRAESTGMMTNSSASCSRPTTCRITSSAAWMPKWHRHGQCHGCRTRLHDAGRRMALAADDPARSGGRRCSPCAGSTTSMLTALLPP